MTEKSRIPSSDIASVRGIGVAVSVSTSTSARSCFRRSFWRTPKRCSSSMITDRKPTHTAPRSDGRRIVQVYHPCPAVPITELGPNVLHVPLLYPPHSILLFHLY